MKIIKYVYWMFVIYRLSFRWMFKINLGDTVIYKGKKRTITNGIVYGKWTLDGGENAPKEQCVKINGIGVAIRNFRQGVRFYKTSWLSIWMNGGIEPWMQECSIWAGKPLRRNKEAKQ